MADFLAGGTPRTPFGVNTFLASTRHTPPTSATFAKEGVPAITIDGETEKILQPGTILCAYTSGANVGKVGAYNAVTGIEGLQTIGNFVGICNTFIGWQLLNRDYDIAVLFGSVPVIQSRCIEYASNVPVALTNTTRDAILALTNNQILFRAA